MSAVGAAAPAEPVLSAEERAAFETGLAQFNDRHFFECHDTLEEVWSGLRGAPRDFFQGLIQASVAFYHLGNGNSSGARSVLERSLSRLEPFPARYGGVELEPLRSALRAFLSALEGKREMPAEPPRIESVAEAGA